MREKITKETPCFTMGVAARMVGLHAQTLRYYERAGLVQPTRTSGNKRLYSKRDIERLIKIRRLTQEMGMSLTGAEAMLRMAGKLAQMEERMGALLQELQGGSGTPEIIDVTPVGKATRQRNESRKARAASNA
ncbi:MAG: MerR family transcriptional regulator [Chloroflexi bacterium]|nr:MerR family transcriptional regulator [Chloroflexota bacterium]